MASLFVYAITALCVAGADSEGGGGSLGSVEPHFDSKFHFYRNVWINLGYCIYPRYSHPLLFVLYFSSTSPFYYL